MAKINKGECISKSSDEDCYASIYNCHRSDIPNIGFSYRGYEASYTRCQ